MQLTLRFLSDPPPPPLRWLWHGVIPARSLVTLAGAPGGGKTALAVLLAMAVARGEALLDRPAQQGGVLFVSAEAGESTARRLRAAAGADADLPVVQAAGPVDLLDSAAAEEIIRAIDGAKARVRTAIRLIVVDALASATRGADENSGRDMGKAMAALHDVIEARGSSILLLAHVGKGGGDLVRGHSGILADVDSHLVLSGDAGIKRLKIVKGRDFEAGETLSFRLASDDPDTFTASVVNGAAPKGARPTKPSPDAGKALKALRDLGGSASIEDWRAATVVAIGPKPTSGAVREAFRKAKAALTGAGLIDINGSTVTVTDPSLNVTAG